MRTFSVTIDETQFSDSPESVFMAIKGVTHIESQEIKPLTNTDWVRSGRPATDEELKKRLNQAFDSGNAIKLDEAFSKSKYL